MTVLDILVEITIQKKTFEQDASHRSPINKIGAFGLNLNQKIKFVFINTHQQEKILALLLK